MDHTSSSRGHNTFAHSKSEAAVPNTSPPSTTVAAAAPESSTLAVKLSEDPEGQTQPGENEAGDDSKQFHREDQRSSFKEGGDIEAHSNSPAIRRSRSGRLLRSTVQYDERSSRSSSPENNADMQGSYGRRTRSSFHIQGGQPDGERHDPSAHDDQGRPLDRNDNEDNGRTRQELESHQRDRYRDDNQDELASDDEQEDDGYGDEADDGNNEGSESMDTNSSKNDDGTEPLVVSMYGSPSLVKVRSMFIDKLYKMVEDHAIQHLISWAKEGDMFYVYNCIELSSSVLPKFFKHNNWQSFVRQLNMYGFHKIYRYDREESTMNRRNPETQRWQFYHPDFQRDRPHLRNNIKRKSARSVNIAPTFSRVVFERDKGYYVQQEPPSRPFNGQGGHSRSHSSAHPQDQHRHGMHGGPPGSVPHHYGPHPSTVHRSPHDSGQRPPAARSVSDYRVPPGHHPNDLAHSRDEKELMAKHHMPPSHQQQHPRGEHEQQHHHQPYPGAPYHPQQQHPYPSPHQRQHSYAGLPSQPHYSPEHGHAHKPQGFSPPHAPPQELHHLGPPPAHPIGPGRAGHPGYGHGSSGREPGYPEQGHDPKHSAAMLSGGHLRSQSAPGLDPRRSEPVPRGPHPFSQHETSNSPPHPSSQTYQTREPYAAQPHPSHAHRHQGSFDEASDLSRRYSPQPALAPPSAAPSSATGSVHHPIPPQQPPLNLAVLPAESLPVTPGMEPSANPNPHDLVPRTIKHLESRLHFVEDAYMSLRHFAQELQNIQVSQDQTIAWMRDRIDQLAEGGTPRDLITSPPLGLAGVVPSKRKANYSSGDPRDWSSSRRAPMEQQQHQQGYSSRQAGPSSGPGTSLPAMPPQQHSPSGGQGQGMSPGGAAQGPPPPQPPPGGRYESSNFHPSFHPIHHQSQSQQPGGPTKQQQQQSSGPPPPQQQQPPQPQRQHPSPPMNASNHPHSYHKASINNMLHD